ncbi:hypothetical protein CMV_021115 [Castanea mollissima]|uniref:non-specific serine/threonine protein kinase n=1 Tax=Castanea mollissima TaxID=60419 RepID=A0A8J4V9J7_9ROSI|nr:hypothetical protein CMV_021115 [Castanea mollissima]
MVTQAVNILVSILHLLPIFYASKMRISKAFFVSLGIFFCFFVCLSHALDTLRPGENLYGTETLVSASGVFELGFFGSSEPSNEYLGIWFTNDKNKKAIWVSNTDAPLLGSPAILSIRYDGNLVISGRGPIPRIVNYGQLATSSNTSAKILDSGNLILMEGEKIIWQSFHYPTDTFLPGMKLGWFDIGTDHVMKAFLVSWLSPSVPGNGPFSLGLDSITWSTFNVWRSDGAYQEIGFWDNNTFRFFFQNPLDGYNFSFFSNSKEVYLTFNNKGSYFSWFVLASNGYINEFKMDGQDISVVNHSLCDDTQLSKSTDCLVMMPSKCEEGGHFSEIRGLMPNSMVINWSIHTGLSDCALICRSNCSCTAYASLHDDGTGCELYYGDRSDLLNMIERGNNTVYVRDDAPESDLQRKRKLVLVIAPVVSLILIILMLFLCYLRWRKCDYLGTNGRQCRITDSVELLLLQLTNNENATNYIELGRKKDHELPLLSFSCIAAATDNFSAANKLGEGGFGPVYKGELRGHEIAIKRLSKRSGQGLEEFKNEVKLISKLQHRNLVKVLGCCLEQEEKILIYEYMANKSLDYFIFDPTRQTSLDWKKRVDIIEGIAQGLLYLHRYSSLRIIHRDLKTSNILLDAYMNPKISDFGMARIFFENDDRSKTKRVVGTYGYMSPEYAVHGLFSTKSDIFSFGVILLEIVSGRKSTTFCQSDSSLNLLGYAWDLWKDGRCVELMDPTLTDSCSFALGLDSNNRTQLKVWHRNGVSRQIAFWDGQRLKFMIESSSEDYNFSFVSKPDEVYITFNTRENYTSSWFVMSSTGQIQEYKMLGQKISMVNRSICENTTVSDATDCYIVRPSLCQDGDKFSEIKGSMPNSIVISDSAHLGLSDCEILCRGNCSCTAFAPFRDDGTGCEFYYGDKRALLGIIGVGKSIIYVRGDILPKPGDTGEQNSRRLRLLVIIPVVSLIVPIIVALICYIQWRKQACRGGKGNEDNTRRSLERFLFQIGSNVAALDEDKPEDRYNQKQDHELPLLSFSCMATATKNFSYENKLGEGGFGPVYKGVLLGHEIAVKRLSKQSGQGLEEFKNEVQLISKLQHRNLVRLLGCCIENEEKILIYEYMVNNSLDSFLFDPTKKILLDWKNRVFIIEGIAQGLLYLHKYSRFRIIHRDLKTSNILLDPHMNPKISDFGMARIFGEDEVRAKTNRVVGTYGYMSPEYVVHGHFSTKSDVFEPTRICLGFVERRKRLGVDGSNII